jgi:hypothetical protein
MGDWLRDNASVLTICTTIALAILGAVLAEGGWQRRQVKRMKEGAEAVTALHAAGLADHAYYLREELAKRVERYLNRHHRWYPRTLWVSWTVLVTLILLSGQVIDADIPLEQQPAYARVMALAGLLALMVMLVTWVGGGVLDMSRRLRDWLAKRAQRGG